MLLKYLSLVDKKIIKNWGESLDSHFCQILWNFLELILWENIGDRLLLNSTPKIWNISNLWRKLLRKSPWSWSSSVTINCIVFQVNLWRNLEYSLKINRENGFEASILTKKMNVVFSKKNWESGSGNFPTFGFLPWDLLFYCFLMIICLSVCLVQPNCNCIISIPNNDI